MSCSDYIPPSKPLLLEHLVVLDSETVPRLKAAMGDRPPAPIITVTRSSTDQCLTPATITRSSASDRRHDPPCMPENTAPVPSRDSPVLRNSAPSSRLMSPVKYDYDPSTLLAHSESLIGPTYDPALYDVISDVVDKKEDEDSSKKSEDYDSGISSPSSSSPPVDSIDIKIAAKKRRRKRRRGTTLAGACFEDCYERTGKILGSGAFSQVELCRCVRTGHEFAVKIIKKDTWYNGYTRARVHQEVEILYRCTGHPNIVQLQDFYEGKDEFYLVFEMMRGGALIDHIERRKTFDERQASTVLYCITSALQHLHSAGIAHRDLKFDNLLCNDPEDFTQVKICDFDLGGQKLDIPYQSTPLMDSPVGSAEFMAPEVVDLFVGHKSTYDKRCDMWSLGITLYIMLFGRPPFTGRCGLQCGWDDGEACGCCQELLFQSITSGRITFPPDNSVSDSAKDLIKKLLVKDARKRYTASQVLAHPWVTGLGTDNVLETPANLRRNTLSATNLGNFAAKANQHYRYLSSGLNGLSEALDNLNLCQQEENLKGKGVDDEEEEEPSPELTPTSDKCDFFISDEDEWYNIP